MIISANVPSSSICTLSSISVCSKAPGMSDTTMYLFSLASIVHDSINASMEMVAKLAYSLFVYSLCGLPSAQPLLESSHDGCFTVFIKFNFLHFYSLSFLNWTFCTLSYVPSSSESSKNLYQFAPFFMSRIALSYVGISCFVVADRFTILLNTLPVMIRLASDSYSSFVQINFSLCQ